MIAKGKKAKASAPPAEEEALYSISRLAEYFDVDRATMSKRLKEAEVKPVVEKAKEKLFRLEDAEAAMAKAEATDPSDPKVRKLTAEAKLKELELERELEELLPRKEVEDYLQKLFTAMFQRLAVRLPRELAPQLAKAENAAQMTRILQTSMETIFNDLRSDHRRFFPSDRAGHSRLVAHDQRVG